MKKLRWGVLGAANIAVMKVIPAIQKSESNEVVALASRDSAKAAAAAEELGIRKAYGSYEEMLADPEIEAVYNPLPNHLHVPLTIKAAEAGKHVLCEKPIGMDRDDALKLLAARDRLGVTIGEAFMVQCHPQWARAIELVRSGRIGPLRFAAGWFGYPKQPAGNIRHIKEMGGGGLMDIGCYPIKTSRMVFGEEPVRVAGTTTIDPETGVDMVSSAILEYPSGHCILSSSTDVALHQKMTFIGQTGRLEVEIPFTPKPTQSTRLHIHVGPDFSVPPEVEEFAPCDQYTLQADQFAQAVRNGTPPPVPIEDSVKNMAVIDAIFRAAASGKWEKV